MSDTLRPSRSTLISVDWLGRLEQEQQRRNPPPPQHLPAPQITAAPAPPGAATAPPGAAPAPPVAADTSAGEKHLPSPPRHPSNSRSWTCRYCFGSVLDVLKPSRSGASPPHARMCLLRGHGFVLVQERDQLWQKIPEVQAPVLLHLDLGGTA
ncbi:uncharacterized protein [Lolium perenne]|uniref:uncharacterized protein n=1 Tax=Lolium perenne TaxID=4522 RepID=UPI0021F58FA2|nr:uncharacterized protein LOC127341549 [Lolium perenne]